MSSLIYQTTEKLEEILTAKLALSEDLDSLCLEYLHLNSKLSSEYIWSLFNARTLEESDTNLQEISAYVAVLRKYRKARE